LSPHDACFPLKEVSLCVCPTTRHLVPKDTKSDAFSLFSLVPLPNHSLRNKLFYPALILFLKSSDSYKTYYTTQNGANEVAFRVRIRLRCGWCTLPAKALSRRSKIGWAPVVSLDFATCETNITENKINFDVIRVSVTLLMSNKINIWYGYDNIKPQDVSSASSSNRRSRSHSVAWMNTHRINIANWN
jgi:hypothetical protein